MTTVIVSGATGFIAQHVVKLLLSKNYQVIGTVRSQSKGEGLLKLFNNPTNLKFEIVEDVGSEGAFDNVLKSHPEATIFLHLASPFHFNATDIEKELLLPAVNGTKNVLEAIYKYGINIEKVVITSSYAAIATASKEANNKEIITEESWNEITWDQALINPVQGYRGSKTFAEKSAWDFIKNHQDTIKFKISFINPSFVFGPQAFPIIDNNKNLNTSSEIINKLLKLNPNSEIPPTKGGWIDVRDVAKAHVLAFEKDSTENKRLLVNSGRFSAISLIRLIHKQFPQLNLPSISDDITDGTETLAKIDDSKTREILGFDYYSLDDSIYDTVSQILSAN
ncbi:putative NADPH-dependent methylglyoxal reductase GRP2 [Candida tropicalis]